MCNFTSGLIFPAEPRRGPHRDRCPRQRHCQVWPRRSGATQPHRRCRLGSIGSGTVVSPLETQMISLRPGNARQLVRDILEVPLKVPFFYLFLRRRCGWAAGVAGGFMTLSNNAGYSLRPCLNRRAAGGPMGLNRIRTALQVEAAMNEVLRRSRAEKPILFQGLSQLFQRSVSTDDHVERG